MIQRDDQAVEDNFDFTANAGAAGSSQKEQAKDIEKQGSSSRRSKSPTKQRRDKRKSVQSEGIGANKRNIPLKLNAITTEFSEKNVQKLPESPRSAFLRKKFEYLENGEEVLENYCCAARMKILL